MNREFEAKSEEWKRHNNETEKNFWRKNEGRKKKLTKNVDAFRLFI